MRAFSRALNLTSLQIFADVVALGSFTAAAERNDITQPAVSFHIRQLEQRFGIPLIERSGRRAIPTVAGAELLRHAVKIDTAVDDAIAAMARHAPGLSGRLRIGTGSTACIALLPPILRSLRDDMPSLAISVMTGNSPEIVKALEDDRIDIGLVTLPVSGRKLVSTPLFVDEIVALVPASMDLPSDVTPSMLFDRSSIVFEPEGATRTLIDTWFADASPSFHPTMTVGSVEAIRELVGMGLGCALLSRMALPANVPIPGMAVHPLSPRLHRTIGWVTRPDQTMSVSMEVFIAGLGRESARFVRLREI